MPNKSKASSDIENIYNLLESGINKNNSIKEYILPNPRQWLGGRFFAIWVLPIFLLKKLNQFAKSSIFIRPYSKNGPSYNRPETLHTSLKMVFKGSDHLRFFDHRFIGIWVLPFAVTGIIFEILFISPLRNSSPFS